MGEKEARVQSLVGEVYIYVREKIKKLCTVQMTSPPWGKGEGRSDWCS